MQADERGREKPNKTTAKKLGQLLKYFLCPLNGVLEDADVMS
jgi:hypothetical protein